MFLRLGLRWPYMHARHARHASVRDDNIVIMNNHYNKTAGNIADDAIIVVKGFPKIVLHAVTATLY